MILLPLPMHYCLENISALHSSTILMHFGVNVWMFYERLLDGRIDGNFYTLPRSCLYLLLSSLSDGKWVLDFIFFVFCAGGKTRQPFLPPACRTILKGSCIVCVFCAPRSGTRVWTCSLISGLLCIFSLLKKQHITSAAPMMIVSFSPSTHPTRILSVYGTYPPYQNGFVLCV